MTGAVVWLIIILVWAAVLWTALNRRQQRRDPIEALFSTPSVPDDDPRWKAQRIPNEDNPFRDRKTEIFNLDGIAWHECPAPPRMHKCTAQTRAWWNYFERVERCRCGAIRRNGRVWIERNTRSDRDNKSLTGYS